MNGKSHSIPIGMVFKKYDCPYCGKRLLKEKTHRVVTKEDNDYYQYHDVGTFPLRDYDVYSYQFRCPSCCRRIAYEEQRIFAKLQKKYGSKVLSPSQIRADYGAIKAEHSKGAFRSTIGIPAVLLFLFFVLYYLFGGERTAERLSYCTIMFAVLTAFSVFMAIKSHWGSHKSRIHRGYSHEQKELLDKLYAYRRANREAISRFQRCYCFRCQKTMEPLAITEYVENGKTALCPYCSFDAILPDAIDEPLDETIIREMHDFWF